MFTPSDPDPREIVRALAEKHGVRPVTATGPLEILDPGQSAEAGLYLRFRSGMAAAEDGQTVIRGARILRAPADAPLVEKVLGLDESDRADFSHVAEVMDDWAEMIHTPPARYGVALGKDVSVRGRHVAP